MAISHGVFHLLKDETYKLVLRPIAYHRGAPVRSDSRARIARLACLYMDAESELIETKRLQQRH